MIVDNIRVFPMSTSDRRLPSLIRPLSAALLPDRRDVHASFRVKKITVSRVYPATGQIPTKIKAFAGDGDNPSYSLFKPFGRLSIIDLKPSREARADWVVGTRKGIELRTGKTLEDWERSRFVRLRERVITDKVSWGPETWFVWRRGA